MASRRVVFAAVVVICLAGAAIAIEPLLLTDPAGNTIRWNEWLEANGPAAVLVWSSWVPGGDVVRDQIPMIRAACEQNRLSLIVVDVQEPIAAGVTALGRTVEWLHDRHGAILKQYRVIELPAIIVVDRDGSLMGRLTPTADAVAGWRGVTEEGAP